LEESLLSGPRVQSISRRSLEQLHPSEISNASEVWTILRQIERSGVVLRRGVNRRIDAETAKIERLDSAGLLLRTETFELSTARPGSVLLLNAAIDGLPLFFATSVLEVGRATIRASLPGVIYRTERRDRARRLPVEEESPTRVRAELPGNASREGRVADISPDGLAILVKGHIESQRGDSLRVEFLDGKRSGELVHAQIRNLSSLSQEPGWQRLGMRVSRAPFSDPIQASHQRFIGGSGVVAEARTRWQILATSMASIGPFRSKRGRDTALSASSADVEVVDYKNERGEGIRAIVDSYGDRQHATAVVIPPAWGKTKETLLPLAATIVDTFRRARKPVVVVRYDGIRKRGESFNEPDCRFPGREHHHFTFSQGVRDIQTTLDFLRASHVPPLKTVLVTFSAASIEGRRAVALEPERISGWISVVGAADLQSAMRVVSGGIDYLGGAERGVSFGIQEVQGVTVDIDRAAPDAIEHGMAFMEDARQDMARIATPISWIHGRHDAWMDLERVQGLLGVGDRASRRLLIVPTGHQLRSSIEALRVFQLIAKEISRLALPDALPASLPNLRSLKIRGLKERGRLPRVSLDRRRFWRDYLLGRDGQLGIELMTATSAYSDLMAAQVGLLELSADQSVADLGCGTGAFAAHLSRSQRTPTGLRVTHVDYVAQALRRIRSRTSLGDQTRVFNTHYISADLELLASNPHVPLADESQHAVLASLLISYVEQPEVLLREIRRVLRPGGRLVLSALKPDADTSRIFVSGAEELRAGRARERLGELGASALETSLRSFLNDAARLLELEEKGVFHFWPKEDLEALLRSSGFVRVRAHTAFGTPPQALVISGQKP
jgi:ubiquinone/menaquinone biosynthesis C-methylase UbiE/pimeloyl-ACP methyl ester carboxylesterase